MHSFLKTTALAIVTLGVALPTFAQEVNVYSYRQPELIKPLMDQFTAQTGITVMSRFSRKA